MTSKMDGVDGCEIPIGRDDTRGSAVCGLYRDGLYRGKIGRTFRAKVAKKSKKITDFSPQSIYMINFKIPKYGSTQKNQLVLNPRTEKYFTRPNDEL